MDRANASGAPRRASQRGRSVDPTLAAISRAALAHNNLDDLLREVSERLASALGPARVGFFQEADGALSRLASAGWSDAPASPLSARGHRSLPPSRCAWRTSRSWPPA